MIYTWISFIAAMLLLVAIARKNLWLGLIIAALILGFSNLPFPTVLKIIFDTVTDVSVVLLAVSVGLIPIIGGALEVSGLMNNLIGSLRMKARTFLMIAPAFMGMMPMPGGALLSAPIISRLGSRVSNEKYAAINVWYRHVFILIYPLGGLLATTKMANLNLYYEMVLLVPGFFLLAILGYLFLIRFVNGDLKFEGNFSFEKFMPAVVVILSAPVIHLILMTTFGSLITEIPLVIGVSTGVFLSFYLGKLNIKSFKSISTKMRPWRYFLIIIAMFIFLNIFKSSGVSSAISSIDFSKTFLIVGVAAILGFVTGRTQVAISILLPIYYAKYGVENLTPVIFAVMFFSSFVGYVVSPIHPCVIVTLEYFKTNLRDFYKKVSLPAVISIVGALIFSIMFVR